MAYGFVESEKNQKKFFVMMEYKVDFFLNHVAIDAW